MHCEQCCIDLSRHQYKYHLRTNLHKSNCLLKSEYENVDIIASAFRNRIMTYRLNPSQKVEYLTVEAFLQDNKSVICKLIDTALVKNHCIKMNFELFANFILLKTNEQQLKSFNTKYETIFQSTDIDEFYSRLIDKLKQKLSEFDHCESGWSFISINHLEININKYAPMRGGSYFELPAIIKNTKSCINVKNTDENCFLWSIVAGLFPATRNVCRTTSYPHYSQVLNVEGMSFPPSVNDIKLFEKNNDQLSINIYGLDDNYAVTGPLYRTIHKKSNHFNLLYVESKGRSHYCLIKDLVRLVRKQVSLNHNKMQLCDTCLQFFPSETKRRNHDCSNVVTILPEKNSLLKFKHYERQQKVNFVIYADFECLLIDCDNKSKTEKTKLNKVHIPSCFSYYVCCSHNQSLNKLVSYRGQDCVEVFIKCLLKEAKYIHNILCTTVVMNPLTEDQERDYERAASCHICKQMLLDDKVRDHDHITGQYRGPAHSHCNLMHKVCPFIPVVFHNLSGYDSHIFITELTKYDGAINIIPKTKESYLTITKFIKTNDCARPIQIKFIDSFHFLSASLDTLCKNLTEKDFTHLSSQFDDEFQCNLLREKGIYPYEYMTCWAKYEETKLPDISHFRSTLKMENISDEEYNRAKMIWQSFDIHSLGEYTDLYIKCDVLLLCDVFENFRSLCLQFYNLDPVYYITSPSLSWDAMLMYTNVELELISDLEIYQFLEKGIRGGLAQCTHRHATANNKYLPDFDDTKPTQYLIYLDCNNLYGYAMTRKVPMSEFKLLSIDEVDQFNVMSISDDANYGYVLEVDLAYPDHLHDSHSDLPFAPERFIPPGGKTPKLIASLYNKHKYVIHYVHLKECIKNGLVLLKVHRILSFRQDNFLQKYIDLNTRLRQASTSAFQKDFFKLLNNAIFGKTIENRRKQVDVKLVTNWDDKCNKTNKHLGAKKLITKPNLKNITVFNDNFIAVQLNREKIYLDRPIYIGFTVLEYAKQHLYKFHYDVMKRKYGNDIKLCYTDTDSLLYLINTIDFYKDMKDDLRKFDTSNFTNENPYAMPKLNAKIPGLFKDELGGDVIAEFVGLRAKLYSLVSVKLKIMKAKGISKAITSKLDIAQYVDSLHNDKNLVCKMNIIKSIKHTLYSQEIDKLVLNRNDDKREILPDQIHTLPWGHYNSMHQNI